jgi:hypothetical protein
MTGQHDSPIVSYGPECDACRLVSVRASVATIREASFGLGPISLSRTLPGLVAERRQPASQRHDSLCEGLWNVERDQAANQASVEPKASPVSGRGPPPSSSPPRHQPKAQSRLTRRELYRQGRLSIQSRTVKKEETLEAASGLLACSKAPLLYQVSGLSFLLLDFILQIVTQLYLHCGEIVAAAGALRREQFGPISVGRTAGAAKMRRAPKESQTMDLLSFALRAMYAATKLGGGCKCQSTTGTW